MSDAACSIILRGGRLGRSLATLDRLVAEAPGLRGVFVALGPAEPVDGPLHAQQSGAVEADAVVRVAPADPPAFVAHRAALANRAAAPFALQPHFVPDAPATPGAAAASGAQAPTSAAAVTGRGPAGLPPAAAALLVLEAVQEAIDEWRHGSDGVAGVKAGGVAAPRLSDDDEIEVAALHDPGAPGAIWTACVGGAVGFLRLSVPAALLRRYFGHAVGLYFDWLALYQQWLVVPAVLGVLAYGYERAAESTVLYPPFAVVVVLWGVGFVKAWERRMQWLKLEHNMLHETSAGSGVSFDAPQRPGYWGERRESPVTGRVVVHYPGWKRSLKQPISWLVSAVFLAGCVAVQVCSLNLQGYMSNEQHAALELPFFDQFAQPGRVFDSNGPLAMAPVTIHVCVILVLNLVYARIADKLTQWENYRTVQEHEAALVAKRVVFEFIDCYITLFYVAFYRLDMPQLRVELFSLYSVDQVRRLAMESVLPYVMGHRRQLADAAKNKAAAAKARAAALRGKKKVDGSDADKTPAGDAPIDSGSPQMIDRRSGGPASAPAEEALGEYETFDDYLEMVMQFGYVVMFATAFPLAAGLSLLSNWFEGRSDLFKLCFVLRRPEPSGPAERRSRDIGPWTTVLKVFALAAVATNTLLFGFTSRRQMEYYFPQFFNTRADVVMDSMAGDDGVRAHALVSGEGRFAVAVVFAIEHVLLLLAVAVLWRVPSMPKAVDDKIQRLRFLRAEAAAAAAERQLEAGSGGTSGMFAAVADATASAAMRVADGMAPDSKTKEE